MITITAGLNLLQQVFHSRLSLVEFILSLKCGKCLGIQLSLLIIAVQRSQHLGFLRFRILLADCRNLLRRNPAKILQFKKQIWLLSLFKYSTKTTYNHHQLLLHKYHNCTYFPCMEILRKSTVSTEFLAIVRSSPETCVFLQNFHNWKFGEISVVYAVIIISYFMVSEIYNY